MSDTMLLGVLRMPLPDNPDPLTLAQLAGRAREAADRIERDAAEIERLRAGIQSLAEPLRDVNAGVLRSGLRDNVDCRRVLHELFEMLPNDRE